MKRGTITTTFHSRQQDPRVRFSCPDEGYSIIKTGFVGVTTVTILQSATPPEMRGRVFGLLGTLSSGLMPLSMGLSGVFADLVDQDIPMVFLICGAITAILSVVVGFSSDFRIYLASDTEGLDSHTADQPEPSVEASRRSTP